MALYIPHSIFHLARLLYVRPETFGPYYVHFITSQKSEGLYYIAVEVWYLATVSTPMSFDKIWKVRVTT
jgi:hypothetical protein